MKKNILMPILAGFALIGNVANAQDFDTDPVVNFKNEAEDVKFTIGARMMSDVAYYKAEITPLKSVAAITY